MSGSHAKTFEITAARFSVVFKPADLPRIRPDETEFALRLGIHTIHVHLGPSVARRLSKHTGGGAINGKLVAGSQLALRDSGFQFFDPPTEPNSRPSGLTSPPKGIVTSTH